VLLITPIAVAEAVLDAALAIAEILRCTRLHSKSPLYGEDGLLTLPFYPIEMGSSRPLAKSPPARAFDSRWFRV
jgi:hypothetical protein